MHPTGDHGRDHWAEWDTDLEHMCGPLHLFDPPLGFAGLPRSWPANGPALLRGITPTRTARPARLSPVPAIRTAGTGTPSHEDTA